MSEFEHPPIYCHSAFQYVRLSEMNAEERSYVEGFIFCRACPIPHDPITNTLIEDAIYLWDYHDWRRWLEAHESDWRSVAKCR